MTTGDIKGDIEVEKPKTEPGGIKITPTEGELPPPLTEEKERIEAEEAEAEIGAKKVIGKMPISPAVIKPPLRFEGMVLAEMTGYPGWMYSEEDLEDIAQLILECGWEADPRLQVLFSLVGMHGARFAGYMQWKRSGRPGDLKKTRGTGEVEKKKIPGEEVIA